MIKRPSPRTRKPESGFTLIELLVVILIVGILAAVAVPQYFKVVEKGKAAEANTWLGGVAGAQETYLARVGNYCSASTCVSGNSFDVIINSALKYYSITTFTTGSTAGIPWWSAVLSRATPVPAVYGSYTITYNKASSPPLSCTGTQCSELLP